MKTTLTETELKASIDMVMERLDAALKEPENFEHWRPYFFGELPDEERESIERLFLTNDRARNIVVAAQEDLIESYLEGTLPEDDKKKFEAQYAATAKQRRELRIRKSIQQFALNEALKLK